MRKVLDHPLGARPRAFRLHAQLITRLLLSFIACLFASSCLLAVAAQDVVNGQVFTQGLSILDSPQPNSVLNAGSDTDISIDVSARTNGALGIDSLEVYLVSAEAQKNITVSPSGAQVLSQEPGSTVKHIHWSVPTCLQTGAYNLTLYEGSHLNDASFFAITPIPIQIRNNGVVSDTCDTPENPVQAQPQPSSPPPPDVLTDGSSVPGSSLASALPGPVTVSLASQTASGSDSVSLTATASSTITAASSEVTGTAQSSSSAGNIITVTAGDGNITAIITGLPGTIVVEPSGGAPPDSDSTTVASSTGFITIFKTVAPTATATLTEIISAPVTITLEETYVSTFTASGTTEEFTVTQTIVSTTELVATHTAAPEQAGLLPINSGSIVLPHSALFIQSSLFASAFLYVMSLLLRS